MGRPPRAEIRTRDVRFKSTDSAPSVKALKGTVSQDFFYLYFFVQRHYLTSFWTIFALGNPHFQLFKILLLDIFTDTQLAFSDACSYKSVRDLQKFTIDLRLVIVVSAFGVCVVNDYSDTVST